MDTVAWSILNNKLMPIDLTGQSFSIAQSIIEQGQSLNLDFSVVNQGSEHVAPFSFDIVISKDDEISSDDFKIGNYKIVTGLDARESSGKKSFSYKTPNKASSFWDGDGTYTVGIIIDPESEFFELNEHNNSNVGLGIDYGTVEIKDFDSVAQDQRADLKGSFIDVANQEITPGEKVDLSFTVENDGHGAANPFSIDIYLSSVNGIGAEDSVKIGRYDIRDGIDANGDTGIKRFSYKTPDLGNAIWGKGDGEYYIALDIDSKGEVPETDETNNRDQGEGLDSTGFDVSGLNTAADLVVKNFSAPHNAKAGDTVEVEYEIVNEGGAKADLFAAGIYLFDQDYLDNNDSLDVGDVPDVVFSQGSGNSSIFNLNPGASTGTVTDEITLPDSWGGYSGNGNYFVGVEADPFDDVEESSDVNNSLRGEMVDYQRIYLEAPKNDTVDLLGTHLEVVQDQIAPGHEFDLGFTVKNDGLAAAHPFSIDMYLSEDAHISPEEDLFLGVYDIRDGLEGMEDSGLRSVRYVAPDASDDFWGDEDGTYYAGMVIDPDNDIAESDEHNNSNVGKGIDFASTHVTGLETSADLKTVSFDVKSETIDTGSSYEVSYEIMNDGSESTGRFGAGFFVFTEEYLMNNDDLDIEDVPQVSFSAGNIADATLDLDAGVSTGMVTTELTMPEDWGGFASGSGYYYVGFAADPYGDITESNEMNNSLNGVGIDYERVFINVDSMDV